MTLSLVTLSLSKGDICYTDSMISIREYQNTDKQTIINWFNQLHDYLIDLDPIKRLRRAPTYGEVFFESSYKQVIEGNGKIFITSDSGTDVGFVSGFIEKQSEKNLLELIPTKLGIVADLLVIENHRKQGVGEALLEYMENYLQAQGCDSLWVNVVAFNPALDFYKNKGYIEREVGMIKQVGQNAV